jgi:ElaB/YqjD/DUF883 family membrane-anchored ribosome-binding protein
MATRKNNKGEALEAAQDAIDHARKAAGSAGDAAELSYDELREQVAVLKRDLVSLADTAQGYVKHKAREAAGDANSARRKAYAAAKDGVHAAGDHFEDAVTHVETFARERPAAALGLSIGAGFLLAMALTRR